MDKKKAHAKVEYAVHSGELIRPDRCQICGGSGKKRRNDKHPPIIGHHADYNKPLEVMWVCRSCHAIIHKGLA